MSPLQEHYDGKYSEEAGRVSAEVITPAKEPRDRFEACITTVLRRFDGGRLLELGAGDGRIARSLLAAGLHCDEMVLTDFSAARISGLRASFDKVPGVLTAQIDAERPDLSLGLFDGVIMVALIEHLLDPMGAMVRLRGMIAPGGFVYIDTPNIAKWTRRIKLAAGRFPSTASTDEGLLTYYDEPVDLYDEGHLHYFTFRSLTRMLTERCGFARVVRVPYAQHDKIPAMLARLRPTLFSEVAVLAYA